MSNDAVSNNAVSRRSFLKAAAAGVGVTMLSACVQPTIAPVQESEGSASGEQPVELSLVHWAGNVEYQALVKMYEVYAEQAPNVKVEWIDASGGQWGVEKMMTMIAGGDAPDIMML